MSSIVRTLSLYVPSSFVTPSFYESASPEEVALALQFGAESFESLQSKTLARVRNETHKETLQELTEEFEAQKEAIEAAAEAKMKALRSEKHRSEEALRVANQRIEAMEQMAATLRQQIQKELKESTQDLLTAKDKQIAQLQTTLEKQVDQLCGKMDHLQNSVTKTFSSSKDKGTLGEALVESLLKKAFDCDVNVISKESQTADIRMTRGKDAAYFWEVKNYTRMVTTEEVEKFRRDLRLHPDVRGGVLVSLRTGIVGRTRGGEIDIEFLEDGRFILFLSNLLHREDAVFYLQTLRPLFQTVESLHKPVQEESASLRALQQKGILITNLLRTHSQNLAKHRNALVGHRKRMDTMFTEFQGYLIEAETQLGSILKVAMGDEKDSSEVAEEVETHLSPSVFKKESLSACEDRTKEFLRWLLSVADVMEGHQIEIKDLVEKAKGKEFGEKFVRGLREELFTERCWERGARYILGLRWKQ